MAKKTIFVAILFFTSFYFLKAQDASTINPEDTNEWTLLWNDEFDYPNASLENRWESQNGPSTHILSSRWRENVVVSDGTLKLIYKKENRGGQEWTSGNIWTKQQFQYGYYECRYKYAAATGTNNSFWLMSRIHNPEIGKRFEIDINEGNFPSTVNTNIHNWTDITTNPITGVQTHPHNGKPIYFGLRPDINIIPEKPIKTKKIRLVSNYYSHFHIREFRIFNDNKLGYPTVLSQTADTDISGLINYARSTSTKITSSGEYNASFPTSNAADGRLNRHWVSQTNGEKWLEFEFEDEKNIGCIQFISGYLSDTTYVSILNDYKVQYYDNNKWIDIVKFDISDIKYDFSNTYNTYGVKWDADSIIFYFNRKVIRREKNEFCFSVTPIWLSAAVTTWAGAVTDAIDGTQMEVDYVRVYKKKTLTSIEPVNDGLKSQVSIFRVGDTISVKSDTKRNMNIFKSDGSLMAHVLLKAGENSINLIPKANFVICCIYDDENIIVKKVII